MKKIGIVIPYDYPIPAVYGGAVETLVQFLIDENEKTPNFEFTVLCTYDPAAEQLWGNYRHTKFVSYKKHQYVDLAWNFIYRCLKKLFKIYIPFSIRYISILHYLKRNRDELDYVLFENGISYMLPLTARAYPKKRILNHSHCPNDGNRKTDKGFEHLLPVSRFCAEQWKRNTGRSEESVHIWRNCFNEDVFGRAVSGTEKQELREQIGIRDDERVIIYVGRIIPEKGVKELLLALQKVAEHKIHLLLIGKSNFGLETKTKYEKEIEEISLKSRYKVSSIGFVKNTELYKYYALSEISVMPTHAEESGGMVNIEAMASGVPVITVNKGAVKEYVGDGAIVIEDDERLVEHLAQSIEELLSDEKRKDELSASGIKRAALFTKKQYFNNFVQIIHEIDSSMPSCLQRSSMENV